MRKEDIDNELKEIAFDFFYWFSRFEFALKENKYLESRVGGSRAKPSWDKFIEDFADKYQLTKNGENLLTLNPTMQIVTNNSELEWKPVGLDNCKSDLARVVRLLKTVRNNLFHGGKHGAVGWDDKNRNRQLLANGKEVLDQLANLANWEADYTQHY